MSDTTSVPSVTPSARARSMSAARERRPRGAVARRRLELGAPRAVAAQRTSAAHNDVGDIATPVRTRFRDVFGVKVVSDGADFWTSTIATIA